MRRVLAFALWVPIAVGLGLVAVIAPPLKPQGVSTADLLIVGLLVVIVVQLWNLLDRLWDFSGQISYVAHLLEQGVPPEQRAKSNSATDDSKSGH
jgi:hypothetical protein